jgi:hypothetical protein
MVMMTARGFVRVRRLRRLNNLKVTIVQPVEYVEYQCNIVKAFAVGPCFDVVNPYLFNRGVMWLSSTYDIYDTHRNVIER